MSFIMYMSMIMFFFIISNILIYINFKLYMKLYLKREKMNPFECGFSPKSSPRLPFSIQFFIISLIFLIFDIEISLIIPFIYSMIFNNFFSNIIIMSYFLLILILGTMFEWMENSFNWNK